MANLSPILKQATPVVAARGEGVQLFDEDGRRYLDFTAGIDIGNFANDLLANIAPR